MSRDVYTSYYSMLTNLILLKYRVMEYNQAPNENLKKHLTRLIQDINLLMIELKETEEVPVSIFQKGYVFTNSTDKEYSFFDQHLGTFMNIVKNPIQGDELDVFWEKSNQLMNIYEENLLSKDLSKELLKKLWN